MLRFTLSIILGLVFPVVGLVVLGSVTDYMQPSVWTELKISGEPAPGLLLVPFSVPIYFDIFVQHNRIAPALFDNFWMRICSFILFNWLLYGSLSYVLLGRLKRFSQRTQRVGKLRPPPPLSQEATHHVLNK